MDQRRHYSHMTCGFYLQPNIVRSKPHETKSGQPICPDRLEDWRRCFPDPLHEVNNLSTMQAEFAF